VALRLVTGRANSGKTGLVLDAALTALGRGESPTLLAPTRADVRRLEDELSGRAPMGVRVSTMRSFATELWSLYGDGRRLVGGAVRQALVARVLAETHAAPLTGVLASPGFARFILDTVVGSAAHPVPMPIAGAPAMSAIASIVDRYREILTELAYIEPAWIPSLLRSGEISLQGPLGLIRFSALPSADAGLLAGLSALNLVTVALTWEAGLPATEGNAAAVARLLEFGAEHVCVPSRPEQGELEALASALYGPPRMLKPSGEVLFGLASGSEAECALAARMARRALDDGYRPERVLVAFRQLARRADLLGPALDAQALDYEFDMTQRAMHSDFGRAFAAVLALATGSGGRSEAMTLLLGPFTDTAADPAMELDRIWRERRPAKPHQVLRDVSRIGGVAGRVARLAQNAGEHPIDTEYGKKWQDIASSMLAVALNAAESDRAGRTADDIAAHNAIVGAIGEMADVPGHPFGARELLAGLPTLSSRRTSRETTGCVQVADLAAVGARRFDVMIVGGMNADEMPVSGAEILEDELGPLLGKEERAHRDGEARTLFYTLVSSTRHRLCLVRQEADDAGTATRPSILWEEVVDAYEPSGRGERPAASAGVSFQLPRSEIGEAAPVFTVGRRALRGAAGTVDLRVVAPDVVTTDGALSSLSTLDGFSATEIESYLQCPYRWFFAHVLRPQEIDAEFGAAELGSRAHRLLAAFYRQMPEVLACRRVTESGLESALALFDRVAEREAETMTIPSSLAERVAATQAKEWARQVVVDDAALMPGFEPAAVEWRFGYDEPFTFAGARFRGSVDRIDRSADALVVTDYKSSREVWGAAKFESRRLIQGVLYGSAAAEILGVPVAGSVYRSLKGRTLRGFWRRELVGAVRQGGCADDELDERAFEQLVCETEALVSAAIGGIRSGRIPRRPYSKDTCRFCGIASNCEASQ